MSFKANIDIFVNFSYVRVRFLNRQGYIRYRVKIYYLHNSCQGSCHPYNIVRGPLDLKKNALVESDHAAESEIQTHEQCYYSKLIPVRYRPDEYPQNETVFFKMYVNTDEIESYKFYCKIQCLFSENPEKGFQVVGKFEAQIRRIYGISTYLPITFDAFQGFMICSTFHSTILEFKYNQEEGENSQVMKTEKKCFDFWSYLDLVTNGFTRGEVMKFYSYYRSFLQTEQQAIQNRHELLFDSFTSFQKQKSLDHLQAVNSLGELQESDTLSQQQFQYKKLMKNKQLLKAIEGRSLNFFTTPNSTISNSEEQEKIIEMMLQDFLNLKGHIYKQWMELANFVISHSGFIANHYRSQYQGLCRDRFKHNVFSHRVKDCDWRMAKYEDSGRANLEHAFMEKKKTVTEEELWTEHFPIENCEYFGKSENSIKFFEEVYLTNQLNNKENLGKGKKTLMNMKIIKPKHIIVLVHGFQASRADFILFKNCLQVTYGVQVIISTSNEGLTDSSILLAGRRLSTEVTKLVLNMNPNYRLSFIGHSMGGLIIRAAVPYLNHLSQKFYSFISLSSPHLGYLYQSGTLIRAGLWLLNNLQKCDSILEISMKDEESLRDTVLYKMSKNGSLKNFKKICLLCSSLDEYVVYQSARIERNEKLMKESLEGEVQEVIREMVEGMVGRLEARQISRINVVFDIKDKTLDSFLGRTGHVKFLSDLQFIREFCCSFDKFLA